jgi:HSP20 family protein
MFERVTGVGDSLFDQFRRMESEMNQLFGTAPLPNSIRAAASGTYPPINIGSTAKQVDVYLFAAGVDPQSLDITIQQNLLTVAGERKLISEQGANYYRKERYDGEFRRVVTLPDDVDADAVEAKYRDGVLHIAIKRSGAAVPRQIQVQ